MGHATIQLRFGYTPDGGDQNGGNVALQVINGAMGNQARFDEAARLPFGQDD